MTALVIFVLLQIADGLLTYQGINAIGIDKYEANSILVYYMHRFGVAESLFIAKALSGLLGYLLYRQKIFSMLWLFNIFCLGILFMHLLMHLFIYNG